jgi:hypothetical protein
MNPIIDKFGTKFWYNDNGQLHRDDGPAVEYANGSRLWYINGKVHRKDGPAQENSEVNRWYINGKLHREDGPAIIFFNGNKFWCINGEKHRLDGPAIKMSDNTEYWYINGEQIDCSDNEEFLRIVSMKEFL